MNLKAFKAKISQAVVTKANIDYEGSIEIDSAILDAAGIYLYECVWIWNVTNGNRLMTYVLEAPKGSGDICPNGAAALLCSPGDKLVITAFAEMPADELKTFSPTVVNLSDSEAGPNKIANVKRLEHRMRSGDELPGGGFRKYGGEF